MVLFLLAEMAAGLGTVLHECDHLLGDAEAHSAPVHDRSHGHHHHGSAGEHTHRGLVLVLSGRATGSASPSVQPGVTLSSGLLARDQDLCGRFAWGERPENTAHYPASQHRGLPDHRLTPPTPPPMVRFS